MKKVVIFASGSGTNAQQIIEFSHLEKSTFKVEAIFCNNPNAFVIQRAKTLNTPCIVFNRDEFNQNGPNSILEILNDIKPDLIVLAGFLWLVPTNIINAFSGKIINIHPALLPKYGGKGMYGENVHKEVIKNKELTSGISIHYVTEKYDDGDIILQKTCQIENQDTPDLLAQKIHNLEKEWFPQTINKLVSSNY